MASFSKRPGPAESAACSRADPPLFLENRPLIKAKTGLSRLQGICLQAIESARRIRVHFSITGTNTRKYPVKGHLSGNSGVETGSYLTAHTTTQSHQTADF
jgi:hypothetical protein